MSLLGGLIMLLFIVMCLVWFLISVALCASVVADWFEGREVSDRLASACSGWVVFGGLVLIIVGTGDKLF
jgi:hypothetical protein